MSFPTPIPLREKMRLVNLLFTSGSPFVGAKEREHRRRVEQPGGNTAVPARCLMEEVEGKQSNREMEKNGRVYMSFVNDFKASP